MLDVHPPHAPTHTWKDFLIHVGTICVGLLIAVSLEQTVEYFHHRHQVHQLEEDLRKEAEINLTDIDVYYRQVDLTMANIVANRDRVDAMRASGAKIKLAYLPFVISGNRGAAARRPSSSVWTIAKEEATAALLPAEEGKFYARVYLQFDLLAESIAREQEALRERANFEGQFTALPREPSAALVPDISRMSVEQLDQEKALLTKYWLAQKKVRDRLDFFYGAETAVVQGRKYEHAVIDLYRPRPLTDDPTPSEKP